jgi:hypothetical protein
MGLNKLMTYRLPHISSYNSCAVRVSFKSSHLLKLAITIENNNQLVFKPTKLEQIGVHEITIIMYDIEGGISEANLTLTVQPIPSFYRILPKTINVKVNQL